VAEYYDISIIGSGNLAWHLAPELENAGHRIVEIYSRTLKNAKSLQKRLYNAEINPTLDFSGSDAEIFIFCISDDAIQNVAQEIALPNGACAFHTSGSQPISKLSYTSTPDIGVFYPLQTFTKGKRISFEEVPILVEAENKTSMNILKNLGKSISKHVLEVSSADRLVIHLAAVFACNFTNYLFAIASRLLDQQGYNFEILRPLIAETINKSLDIGPENAQTGPAARGDIEILDKHMAILQKSEYKEIYHLITEKILKG